MIADLKKIKWAEPEKLESLVEPAILLEDVIRKGGRGDSKLGGNPDLPSTLEWPRYHGKPMVFLAQINLEELKGLDVENVLPDRGILYFFSYFKEPQSEYGAEYEFLMPKDQYKVLYFDGNKNNLKAQAFPQDLYTGYQFREMPVNFRLIYQVPNSIETWRYEQAGLNEVDENLYLEYTDDQCEPEMILGTPCPIQYGVDYDWAYSYLDIKDFEDPQLQEKTSKVRPDFINLLSFEMIGRFEKIGIPNCYFGIRRQDLEKKDFSKVIFIMQDT